MARAKQSGDRSTPASANGLPVDYQPAGLKQITVSDLTSGQWYAFYDKDPATAPANSPAQAVPVYIRPELAGKLRVQTFGPCADTGEVLTFAAGSTYFQPIKRIFLADRDTIDVVSILHDEPSQIFLRAESAS